MDFESQAIQRNDTSEFVDPPPNCKIVGLKRIFKTKLKETKVIDKFKARLVAKGYTQEERIEYREIFSLVARLETIRIVVALATTKRWSIYQLDIKSAFLHGEINEDVYLEQPPRTQNLGIFYKVGGNEELLAYTDSDYARDLDDRKGTSSYAFILGGGVICWASKKQLVVSLSSTEVEFIAAALCLANL
ncbi:hypothetical protein CR513_02542, partial [Mucuna pruriens]